jgi:hypothetical protein
MKLYVSPFLIISFIGYRFIYEFLLLVCIASNFEGFVCEPASNYLKNLDVCNIPNFFRIFSAILNLDLTLSIGCSYFRFVFLSVKSENVSRSTI